MAKIVQIQMDKERNLKFGMNQIMELEKDMGKPLAEIGDTFTFEQLFKVAYFGLKWEDKKLKFEDIGDLLDEAIEHYDGINNVIPVLMKAFTSAMGGSAAVPSKK